MFRRNDENKLQFVIDGAAAQHWPRIRTASFHLETGGLFTPKDLGEALGLTSRQARRIIQQWFYDDVVNNRAGSYAFTEEIRGALGKEKLDKETTPEEF